MFCAKCGAEYIGTPNFCAKCGAELREGPPADTREDVPDTIEGLCQLFYDWGMFHATVVGEDRWSAFLDSLHNRVSQADSGARIDRSQFQRELTALRLEVFNLAVFATYPAPNIPVRARRFTKLYLEESGHKDLFGIMMTYNEMLAESTTRDSSGRRPKGDKEKAMLASTNRARMDWYDAWINANISEKARQKPEDMTPQELEFLDAAGAACNHVGVDIRKNNFISARMLSWRLAVHLCPDGHKLKDKALDPLIEAILKFYSLSEHYLKNPEKHMGVGGRMGLPSVI